MWKHFATSFVRDKSRDKIVFLKPTFYVSRCLKRLGHLQSVPHKFGRERCFTGHVRYNNQAFWDAVTTVRSLLCRSVVCHEYWVSEAGIVAYCQWIAL